MDWFLPYPQFQFLGYLVQFIPVDTIPSPSQQPRQVSLLHSAPLIAVLRLDDVLVHSPREPYKFLLRAELSKPLHLLFLWMRGARVCRPFHTGFHRVFTGIHWTFTGTDYTGT